jgi:ABC-type transport system substrate-binding protein
MSKFKITWAFLVAVLLAAAAAVGCGSNPTTPTTVDPTGTWVGTATSPLGSSNVTLVLARASGVYQGTVSDDQGKIARNTPISNVSWNGSTLTFTFQMADGTGVSVTTQINGDTMTGNYVDSQGERGSVSCTRRR